MHVHYGREAVTFCVEAVIGYFDFLSYLETEGRGVYSNDFRGRSREREVERERVV